MSIDFGTDSSPAASAALPGSNVGLGWYNIHRKRLQKFAEQYFALEPAAVQVLRSQGERDTSLNAVKVSRAGFTELRARLPVLNQYYTYTGMHGGTPDSRYLAKIKDIILAWCDKNEPTGKPIDETNFENLLRVIKARWADFTVSEQSRINTWLQALRSSKEAWAFIPANGEGSLQYGNHYTHHYKILLMVYDLLGMTTAYAGVLNALDAFALVNFPYGNASVTVPGDMPRAAVDVGESIDYIRRDALHYHHYNLEPWLEIALIEGGTRYQTIVERAFTFLENQILNAPVKHYEFAATTDPFDGLRWQASHPEYLQPQAMYRPDRAARVVFAYDYYRRLSNPLFQVDARLINAAVRSDVLPSFWYYYFRWVFGGMYG